MDSVKKLEEQVRILQQQCDNLQIVARQAETALEKETIIRHVREAALAEGVRVDALDDLCDRAIRSGEWKVSSTGKLYRTEGGVPLVDTNGDYISPRTWLRSVRSEADFYFSDPSKQAGAGAPNPWSREHWSLTEQGKIARESNDGLARAEQMARAAGSRLGATRPQE